MLGFSPQKLNQFRTGWTRQLDAKGKARTQLTRLGDATKPQVKRMDIEIKRMFMKNVQTICRQMGDEMNSSAPPQQLRTIAMA